MWLNNRKNRRNQSIENKVLNTAEYSGKIKIVFFVEQETLCDSAVTD